MNPDKLESSCTESGNGSFLSAQYESLDQSLDSSYQPAFEFSSPISSIASTSANSTPEREQTLQPKLPLDEFNDNFMSIEEMQSLISLPYDDTPKSAEGLETIFENCYLETGRTPTTPRLNRPRRARINLNNFDEFKENVQNHKLPDQSSTDLSREEFPRLSLDQD